LLKAKECSVFAEFGVLNYLTYLVGAIFIILVPGPNTFFVLKTGIAHGVKKGYLAAAGVFIGDAVLMLLAFTLALDETAIASSLCIQRKAFSSREIC